MLYYLATAYSLYPRGLEAAYREACSIIVRLQDRGLRVFSPIAVYHPVARDCCLNGRDHEFWMRRCRPWIGDCDALIVAMMDGWEQSRGIAEERELFMRAGKKVQMIDPVTLSGIYGE